VSFVLKIVAGPNRGAEIALVEGVAVTLGKNDDCDIVLADSSLPDAPVKIETSADGVSVDGEVLAPLNVRTLGETSFAVGPAEGAWGKLTWPEKEGKADETKPEEAVAGQPTKAEEEAAPQETQDAGEGGDEGKTRKRRGCLAPFLVIILVMAMLFAAGWYFRGWLKPRLEPYRPQAEATWRWTRDHAKTAYAWCREEGAGLWHMAVSMVGEKQPPEPPRPASEIIADIAAENGLKVGEANGNLVLSGNLKTRAERLSVTAKAYSAMPYVELDLSDDETMKTAVLDTLALIGEKGVAVREVTNRIVVLERAVRDLPRLAERIMSEVPKIRGLEVDAEGQEESAGGDVEAAGRDAAEAAVQNGKQETPAEVAEDEPAKPMPRLPLAGILTTPYPCLVTRNGVRIMEGASIGDWKVVKIEADAVLLENGGERRTWQP